MIRFGIILALCHVVFAGIPNYSPYLTKNTIFGGQQKYDSAKYPAQQQFFESNHSQYQTTALLASKFSHLTKTWVAGSNPRYPSAYMGGVRLERLRETRLPIGISIYDEDDLVLPQSFDARQRWPECPSLGVVRDQGCCGSCWAMSAVTAMTDRWCIHSGGKKQFSFGAHDLMSCCFDCGNGCYGGDLGPAWQYWVDHGISSGGPYGSQQGCHPYPVDVCPENKEDVVVVNPKCLKQCRSGYNVSEAVQDRRYGRLAYSLPNDEEKIMEEIYRNGPVQAGFRLFYDFVTYKSGVYRHVWSPPSDDGHAAVIIGWGVENGVKYWLCKNSWGLGWGDGGFFKIVRGENHVHFEEYIHAGLPSYERDSSDYGYY